MGNEEKQYTHCLREIGLILNETIIAFKAIKMRVQHIHSFIRWQKEENKQLNEFIWLCMKGKVCVCVYVNICARKKRSAKPNKRSSI